MDAYTLHLLGLAVEACKVDLLIERVHSEALAALLTELGVTVPERPRDEKVSGARNAMWSYPQSYYFLTELYARDPLTVISMLEGGGS